MTTTSFNHPSFLALDRAALGSSSVELRAHIERCEACRAYVESLTEAPPVSSLPELRRRAQRQTQRLYRAWWAFAPLAAAACALLFFGLRPRDDRTEGSSGYVGAKGFASVWIYVKHGPRTELWDGKRPLSAGDQLRLKVDPGDYSQVAVYSLKQQDAPERLYAGTATPGVTSTLPDAWELDAEPGAERLVVVLSHAPVTPSWPEWWDGDAGSGVLVLRFELPKVADADAGDGTP
jgi:hypothetical protein